MFFVTKKFVFTKRQKGFWGIEKHEFVVTSNSCFSWRKNSFIRNVKRIFYKKHTALTIPVWSPTTVLGKPNLAWLRSSDGIRYIQGGMTVWCKWSFTIILMHFLVNTFVRTQFLRPPWISPLPNCNTKKWLSHIALAEGNLFYHLGWQSVTSFLTALADHVVWWMARTHCFVLVTT